MSKYREELRRRFRNASREEKERILLVMTAYLAGMLAADRGKEAPAVDGEDVQLDADVWGGLFDDEGQ